MLNAMGLGFIFRAKDETSEVIEKIHGGLEGLHRGAEAAGESITKAIGMGTTAILGMGVAVAAVAGGVMFEFAEHADRLTLAITQAGAAAHATTEQIHELEEIALHKGMDSLYFSSIAAAESLRDLAKEGMSASEAGKALDGTMDLLRISMGALTSGDAAATVHDSLKQFGMQASQASELTDKLAYSMRAFGFQASELRGAMSGLASGAALTGASLDDTLIGVGLIHQTFPDATRAAMAMNMAMQQLASTKVQKELRGIGVTVADTTGKINPLIDIIQQLSGATSRMTDAQLANKLETIAGGRAAGGLSAIIDGLRKGVKDANGNLLTGAAAVAFLRDQMAHTAGTAKDMSDILGGTMADQIEGMKNALSNLGVVIGSGFESPFKKAFQGINLFIRGITQLFSQGGFSGEVKEALDKHPLVKGFAEKVFVTVKRVQHFFEELSDGFSRAFAPFRPILDQLVGAFSKLGSALGLTDQSASENASTWDTLGAIGGAAGDILGKIAGNVLPILTTAIDMTADVVKGLRNAWEDLKPTIMSSWQTLSGVFGLIGGLLSGNWKMMWDGAVDTVVGAAKLVMDIVFAMVKGVTHAIDGVAGAFGMNSGLTEKLNQFQKTLDSGTLSGTEVLKSFVSAPPMGPAVAAHVATIHGTRRAAAEAEALYYAKSSGNPREEKYIQAHISIDGQKVFDAMMKAKRAGDNIHFVPVPAHGG